MRRIVSGTVERGAPYMLQGYLSIIIAMLIWGSVGVVVRWAGQEPLITVTYRVLIAAIALGLLSLAQRRGSLPGPGLEPGPEPGPGLEPAPEPAPEPGPEPGPGLEPGPKPGPKPGPEPGPGLEPAPEPAPEPGPEPGPGLEPGPKPGPKPGPEPGPGPAAPKASPWLLGLSGVALALNWLFFFKALATTSVSNTVLAYYTAPVWVALAAPALLGERLERRTIIATAVAFAGICIMLYQPGEALSASDLLGIGFGLIAALFYASVTITGRRLAGVPAPHLVLVQCAVAAAILLPTVLLTEGPRALAASPGALGLLAVVGVVHTAFALILYFQGLRTVKVQHAGVLGYLDPVSAVLFAFVFLKEVPSAASLAGGALVLGGSALLLGRQAKG